MKHEDVISHILVIGEITNKNSTIQYERKNLLAI